MSASEFFNCRGVFIGKTIGDLRAWLSRHVPRTTKAPFVVDGVALPDDQVLAATDAGKILTIAVQIPLSMSADGAMAVGQSLRDIQHNWSRVDFIPRLGQAEKIEVDGAARDLDYVVRPENQVIVFHSPMHLMI